MNGVSTRAMRHQTERARGRVQPLPASAARPSLTGLGRACGLLFLVLVCVQGALAASLSDYQERVHRALVHVGSLGASRHGAEAAEATIIRDVKQLLPASETIEWQGGLLRVDNSWLVEALDNYERLPAADHKRVEAMTRIAERLQAISERLAEMGRAAADATTIDKDEEKARLAAILRREEYSRPVAEDNAFTRLLKRIRDWFRSLFPERDDSDEPESESRLVNSTAQLIVILLSLAVIAYVAWRFLPRLLGREMRKRKPGERRPRVVLGEQLTGDESSAELLDEAEKLARAGDLRAAIRKGYIALLCELHDRKLVRLEQHKTNRDYLRAVQPNAPLYQEMKPMTRSFENHWYGFIPATETDWQDFRSHYKKALSDR